MSDDPVIEIRDLAVGGDGTWDLDGVTLDVRRGERLGVVARNGSSRSALVASLLGNLEDRVRGDVIFSLPDGNPVDVLDLDRTEARRFRWRHVALVPANASGAFNPSTNVGAAFEETLRAHRTDVRGGMERASNLLSSLGLDPDPTLEAIPDELDDSQLERVALALALLLEPAVLVVEDSESVFGLIGSSASVLPDDLAVVAVGSDPRPIASFATTLAVLYGGEIVETGPTTDVVEDPDHPFTRELVGDF